mgnify:CR=1 FL=1
MKKFWILIAMMCLFICGCENLRFAPSEHQKRNAWLHNRTAEALAKEVKVLGVSEQVIDLANLNQLQSRAFVTYFRRGKF